MSVTNAKMYGKVSFKYNNIKHETEFLHVFVFLGF